MKRRQKANENCSHSSWLALRMLNLSKKNKIKEKEKEAGKAAGSS
jgi:hypothetical protein